MMLDSGSTISLIQGSVATGLPAVKQLASNELQLVSAAGEPIPVVGRVVLPVQVGGLHVEHPMIVVQSLITQVILGMDFLQKHGLVLDFTLPVNIQLRDFVETHITEAQHLQRSSYDHGTWARDFCVGDPVWLSIPTAGKLDPRWEGKWRIHAIPGPVTYIIYDGTSYRTVHVNRLRHRIQPDIQSTPIHAESGQNTTIWRAPTVEHHITMDDPVSDGQYPQRIRRPPDRLQM